MLIPGSSFAQHGMQASKRSPEVLPVASACQTGRALLLTGELLLDDHQHELLECRRGQKVDQAHVMQVRDVDYNPKRQNTLVRTQAEFLFLFWGLNLLIWSRHLGHESSPFPRMAICPDHSGNK
jgi:hypothetical protein